MKRYSKILLFAVGLNAVVFFAFADRGGIVKNAKPELNIAMKGTLKNSVLLNLKSGLAFKGSEIVNLHKVGNSIVGDAYVSYQKGNTLYLVPYKQKIATPQFSAKDGYKLIIRSK